MIILPKARQRKAGMALVTALIFTTVTVLVLTSMTTRYVQQRLQVDRFEDYYACFEGVEAAMQLCLLDLQNGGSGIIGLEEWEPEYDANNTLILPEFESEYESEQAQAGFTGFGLVSAALNWFTGQTPPTAEVTPMTLPSMPGVSFIGYSVLWFGNGRDMNGDGIVDSDEEQDMVTIYTAARAPGAARQVEAVYGGFDVNVWRNAIFAGTGQSGRLVNGNVSIHGSMHLLGDDLPSGGLAINSLEMSGTSLVSNNYEGMPGDLAARIPPLPRVMYDGENVATLHSNVRVKRGLVSMSGNSRIGLAQQSGTGSKNPVDGTYINDGWTGNSVDNSDPRGIPSSVVSDNGHTELYDLGNQVSMPMLDDDWRDIDGARTMNPYTGTWYTHEEYFTEVLLADPAIRTDGIYSGNITINARNSDHYYWNATTETELSGAAALAATPNSSDDFMKYDANNKTLTINGQIRIDGDLSFTGQGNQSTIHYSGRAAFLVDGDVEIDANLLTCNNGNPADTANSFPVNNIMGIMSTQDMVVGASSQLSIMGAFYAQGTIETRRQSNILGTFVANYFDMGTNVPSIFQVPALADNLPYGMIGNFPILMLQQASWRELGVV